MPENYAFYPLATGFCPLETGVYPPFWPYQRPKTVVREAFDPVADPCCVRARAAATAGHAA